MRDVDVAPLTTRVTWLDRKFARGSLPPRRTRAISGGPFATASVIVPIILVVVAGGTALAFLIASGDIVEGVVLALLCGALIAAAVWVLRRRSGIEFGRRRLDRIVRLERFAHANGLLFSAHSADHRYPFLFFTQGDDRAVVDHLRTTRGRFVDIGTLQFVTKHGTRQVLPVTETAGFLAVALDSPRRQLDEDRLRAVLREKGFGLHLSDNWMLGTSRIPADLLDPDTYRWIDSVVAVVDAA